MLLNNLFEELARTGKGKAAVVGWGRGMGHKGHMFLASSVITQARESNADPYFVVSRTVGKDDPINPEEKLAIYKKVFPQSGHIFQTATEEMPDLTQVLKKLQGLGYTDVTVVVGADQVKALGYVKNYNGKPNKSGDILFNFNTLNVISRQETSDPSRDQEGPRATPMRDVLKDPAKSEEEKFAIWRNAMSPELSDDEVRDLMNKAGGRMAALAAPKPKKVKTVAEESNNVKSLQIELWNLYKDVTGFRPRLGTVDWTKEQWDNPEFLKAQIAKLSGQDLAEGVICTQCEADPCICDDSHGFVSEERMSAAVRMQRAADRQRAKSDASLRRTPSSIPKPEPKKDEKTNEEGGVGVIASKKQAKDPRYSTSLTVDVHPGQVEKNLKAFSLAEKMMPASNFAGSKKNKLGPAGQWKNTGPKKNKPAKAGDLVGGMEESNEPFRGTAGAFNRGDDERHDQDPTDWYIVKDGKMFAASIYPRQVKQAIAQGFSRTKQEARARASSEGVAETNKKKGADGKACWKGYKYAGTENGKDRCVPMSENVENIMDSLINKIVVNEAISNNKR